MASSCTCGPGLITSNGAFETFDNVQILALSFSRRGVPGFELEQIKAWFNRMFDEVHQMNCPSKLHRMFA